jgi:hypothetical protein
MNIEWINKDGKKLASGRVVQDGEKLKVPLMMTDAATVDIAAITRAAITNAPMPSAAMHRPGSLALSDADRAARDKALAARDQRLVDAWKNPAALQAPVTDATQRTTPADVTMVNSARARKMARQAEAWKMKMGATR